MRRPFNHLRLSIATAILLVFSSVGLTRAEEIIIQEIGSDRTIEVGDYSCSPCFSKLASALEFRPNADPNTIEVTAGELWQFFDSQGHQSVSTLTLFLDVDQIDLSDSFNLSKLDIEIHGPTGELATDTKLRGHQLIVPGAETSKNRPEAELQFDLGYDFMKLFSSDSTEIVRVSIDSPIGEAAITPRFHLGATHGLWGRTDLSTMFLFVLFWGAVFLALLKWMRPERQSTAPATATRTAIPKTPHAHV